MLAPLVPWAKATRCVTLALVVTGCTSEPSPSLLLPLESATPRVAETSASASVPATPERTATNGELDRVLTDTEGLRAQRESLVQVVIAPVVEDERIVEAFRAVPRHMFVPTDVHDRAYGDYPLPLEAGQTISQPSLVAMMTELLELDSGERVLEIGTGSGFQAAILRQLTDEVYSVEIIPELHRIATEVLEHLGYGDIQLDRRDGYHGWEEAAPFDAIVVTAAADHLPPPLVDQLDPDGGRMVIPIGPVGDVQTLWLVTRTGDEVAMEEILPVAFVPLTREEP